MPDSGAQRDERFDQAVGSLSNGELLLPAITSMAQSAALAANRSTGDEAEAAYELARLIRTLHFRVHVSVLAPDQPEVGEREVIDTVTHGLNPLTALLETLLDEIADLYERKHNNEGTG